jgi:hypothetical protein
MGSLSKPNETRRNMVRGAFVHLFIERGTFFEFWQMIWPHIFPAKEWETFLFNLKNDLLARSGYFERVDFTHFSFSLKTSKYLPMKF